MLATLFSVTLQVLLFRAGPQDFPYLPQWTRTFCVLGATPVFMVYALALAPAMALVMAAATVLGMALVTRGILRARKLDARFTQTLHTLLCTGGFITLLMVPAFAQVAPKIAEIAANPEAFGPDAPPPELPQGPVLIMNLLNVWNFLVTAQVFRHAANSGFGMGLLFALLAAAVILGTVLMFGSLFGALLGLAG
jgi:hypothetical protein